jgi:hypothetical protein
MRLHLRILVVASLCSGGSAAPGAQLPRAARSSADCIHPRSVSGRSSRFEVAGVTSAATFSNACAAGSRARAEGLVVGRGGATAAQAGAAPPPPAGNTAQLCAQALGVCVTVGSFTLKLPQIHQCVVANSVEVMHLACILSFHLAATADAPDREVDAQVITGLGASSKK